MFQNARAYNMEGSEIVADVGRMELQAPPALVHLRGAECGMRRATSGQRAGGRNAPGGAGHAAVGLGDDADGREEEG